MHTQQVFLFSATFIVPRFSIFFFSQRSHRLGQTIVPQNCNSEETSGNLEMKSFYVMSMAAQRFLRDSERESVEGRKIPHVPGWKFSFLKECLFIIYLFIYFEERSGGKELGKRTNSELSFPNSKKNHHRLLPRPKAE